jgi:hypothetical protein
MLPDFLSGVSITNASVSSPLENSTSSGVLWQAAPNRFLLDAPDTARYLVEGGKQVTIDPHPSADKSEVSRFLRMTPLAALLFQRDVLAFHAAAVAGPDGAVVIAGDSGAGKSTLLAALLKRGWNMLADDLTAVDVNENGAPTVFPIFPEVMLWPDSMKQLKIETKDSGRHILPMEDRFAASPQPLRAIYRLSVHKEELDIDEIKGTKLFNTLTMLSYNSRIADALLDRSAYMRLAAAIAKTVSVRTLRRPRGQWCIEELADIVEGGGQ